MIRLIIAEDHQAFTDGIAAYLEYNDEIKLIDSVSDGEALVKSVSRLQPDVVITDLRMPKLDGLEASKRIRANFPKIKIIALTMFDRIETVNKAFQAGVNGYLLKNSGLKIMIEAINTVLLGKTYYDPNLAASFLENTNDNKRKGILSKREKEILYLIGKGKSSTEISVELSISKTTVDTHRKNMCRKLGINGSNALFQYALEKKY